MICRLGWWSKGSCEKLDKFSGYARVFEEQLECLKGRQKWRFERSTSVPIGEFTS